MVTFSLAHADAPAVPAAFRVPARSVAFAGSRNGGVTPSVASRLVDGFLRLGFGFSTGCASGVDRCFRTALTANRQAAEKTIVACAFPDRARRFSVGEVFATTVVPPGLSSAAAALHRRTVWMVRRCSLLVLFPDNRSTGRWGPGSRLALRTARYNLKPVFLVTATVPKPAPWELVRKANLFGTVDGYWMLPHPTEEGTCDEPW